MDNLYRIIDECEGLATSAENSVVADLAAQVSRLARVVEDLIPASPPQSEEWDEERDEEPSQGTHPTQPLERDTRGVLQFKRNHIVRFLLDCGKIDMNVIGNGPFSHEDRVQFAQLIGYTAAGFARLPYVTEEDRKVALRQTGVKREPKAPRHAAYLRACAERLNRELSEGEQLKALECLVYETELDANNLRKALSTLLSCIDSSPSGGELQGACVEARKALYPNNTSEQQPA